MHKLKKEILNIIPIYYLIIHEKIKQNIKKLEN